MVKVSEEELSRIFKALSHEVRRRVVLILGERGPLPYVELMKYVGIEDSGHFAFHLRSLQGLIEKDEKGLYRLSQLGWKVYRILKDLYSGEDEKAKATELFVFRDAISIHVTKELLTRLRERGQKAIIRDAISVTVDDDVDAELFDTVIERIEDVVSLRVPKHLRELALLKCRDVLSISTEDEGKFLGLICGLTKPMSTALSSVLRSVGTALSSALKSLSLGWIGLGMKEKVLDRSVELRHEADVTVEVGSGSIVLKPGSGRVVVWCEKGKEPSIELTTEDRVLSLVCDVGEVHLELPIEKLRNLKTKVHSGSVKLSINRARLSKLEVDVDIGTVAIDGSNIYIEELSTQIETGTLVVNAVYSSEVSESEVRLRVGVGTIKASLKVPGEVKVRIEPRVEVGTCIVRGPSGVCGYYVEPGFNEASKKFSIIAEVRCGTLSLEVAKV